MGGQVREKILAQWRSVLSQSVWGRVFARSDGLAQGTCPVTEPILVVLSTEGIRPLLRGDLRGLRSEAVIDSSVMPASLGRRWKTFGSARQKVSRWPTCSAWCCAAHAASLGTSPPNEDWRAKVLAERSLEGCFMSSTSVTGWTKSSSPRTTRVTTRPDIPRSLLRSVRSGSYPRRSPVVRLGSGSFQQILAEVPADAGVGPHQEKSPNTDIRVGQAAPPGGWLLGEGVPKWRQA